MTADPSSPLILVAGMPTVFDAIESAGFRVHPGSGDAETKFLSQVSRACAQRNDPYVVLSRLPDQRTRMWLAMVAAQGVKVVVLSDGSADDTGLPATVEVLGLPASINRIAEALGVTPSTGGMGQAIVDITLAVKMAGDELAGGGQVTGGPAGDTFFDEFETVPSPPVRPAAEDRPGTTAGDITGPLPVVTEPVIQQPPAAAAPVARPVPVPAPVPVATPRAAADPEDAAEEAPPPISDRPVFSLDDLDPGFDSDFDQPPNPEPLTTEIAETPPTTAPAPRPTYDEDGFEVMDDSPPAPPASVPASDFIPGESNPLPDIGTPFDDDPDGLPATPVPPAGIADAFDDVWDADPTSVPDPVSTPAPAQVPAPVPSPVPTAVAGRRSVPAPVPAAQPLSQPRRFPVPVADQPPATTPTAPPADYSDQVVPVGQGHLGEFPRPRAGTGRSALRITGQGALLVDFASKGGVGKSSIAMMLAERAAVLGGLSVALIDGNRGQADLGRYLALKQASLPSVLDAALRGDPVRAISPPSEVNAARQPGLDPVHFYLVLGASEELADPKVVTAEVYRQIIELCRAKCDITVVDSQIVEHYDLSGIFERTLIPAMAADGGYAIGISDTTPPGLSNLFKRMMQFRAEGVPTARMFSMVNRTIPEFEGESAAKAAEVFSQYSTYVGHVPAEPSAITHAVNSGKIPHDVPAMARVLDEILFKVTGMPQFDPAKHVAPAKRWTLPGIRRRRAGA